MKIVLDDGAFKPYKAHPEDAGFDLMARGRQTVPAHGSATFDYGPTEFEVIGNIYDNKLEDFNNGTC